MMSRWAYRSLPLLLALTTSACTEMLLGDKPFVLRDDSAAQGGGGAGGDVDTTGNAGGVWSTGTTTGALVCDNGATACAGACVTLSTDSLNCGACGHSCYGAACESGLCAVETVTSGIDDPQGIATDDVFVYWTTGDGRVQRSAKSGGPVFTLAEEQESPGAILIDTIYVYWINDATGTVVRMAKDGSGKSKSLLTSAGLQGLALDNTGLYLSRKLKKGSIQRIDKDGGGPKTLAKNQPTPTYITVFNQQVMWAGVIAEDDDSNDDGVPDGEEGMVGGYVNCAPSEGGDVVSLATSEGQIVGLVATGNTAIWADEQSHRIRARSLLASTTVTLVDSQHVRGLAASGDDVYWTTEGGSVKRVAVTGGSSNVLATDLQGAGAATVDGTHVYIAQKGSPGAIVRVAR